MKSAVAIVAAVVGVTGLCHASEISTDQRPAVVATPQRTTASPATGHWVIQPDGTSAHWVGPQPAPRVLSLPAVSAPVRQWANADVCFVTRDLTSVVPDMSVAAQIPLEDVIGKVRRAANWSDLGPPTFVLSATTKAAEYVSQLGPSADPGQCFAVDGVAPEQRIESCTAVIQSAGQTTQTLAVAYGNRGNVYNRKGNYDRAIADFDQAIRLDRKFAAAYINRGIAYNGKGQHDRAITDLDEAIRLDPKDAAAYANRGIAYKSKGSYDRAIEDYDEAIRLVPKNAQAYANRGFAYKSKGEHDRAIADYDEAIRLDPKFAKAYAARGDAYAGKRDYARAIADYDQTLTLDPTLAVARQNRQFAQNVIATQTAPAPAERRVALVIGNSQYRSVAFLSNPRRDAKAVAEALRHTGFQTVDLKMDLDRDAMVKALHAFRDQADKADWALIYFAGHGIEINRVNYLVPVDAKLRDDRDVHAEAVSYEELLNTIGRAKALRLVILDACRVNPFKERMNRTMALRGSADRGLAPPPKRRLERW